MRLLACSTVLWLAACVRLDPDHCANQRDEETPDQYCVRLFGGVCSACEANFNGCVDPTVVIEPQCRPGGGTGDTGVASTMGSTTLGSSSSVSSSGTAGMETTEGADSSAGDASGESSSTGVPPEPICGDGKREGGEVCDGVDVGEQNCKSFNLGPGDISCNENCTPNFEGCENEANCGNNVVEGDEDCDAANLGGATCETLPGYIGGDLSCANCTFNISACDACLRGGDSCSSGAMCCSGACLGGLLGCLGNG